MTLRRPSCLLLPFYCDGYELDVAAQHVEKTKQVLERCGAEVEVSPLICSADEAEKAAAQYNAANYDLAVLFPATWSEPRLACLAARAFFGKPILVWCVGQFSHKGETLEMSSLPASAALRGSLQEMGVPCEWMSYLPDEGLSGANEKKLRALLAAARAIRLLAHTRMMFFGHNFNGITSAGFDLSVLRRRFGTEIWTTDGSELIARMNAVTDEAYREAESLVSAKLRGDPGGKRDAIIRMTAALRGYVREYGLHAVNMRCHTEFSQTFGLTGCLPLSLLGDEVITSCEADVPVTLTQLLLHYLADANSAYVDLRLLEDGCVKVGACGMAPCSLCMGACAKVGGEGGYLTNTSFFKPGKLTLARLLKFPGGRLALHRAAGTATGEMAPLREMGCAVYPMTQISLDTPIAAFSEYLGGNHYALVYAEVEDALRLFAKYTDIEIM
ncbi:MAG: hypothetical protein IJT18_04055 [Oscillospiraceae bacterium]|nr:hypothetical protein [Oscillospiraceae bacterium]